MQSIRRTLPGLVCTAVISCISTAVSATGEEDTARAKAALCTHCHGIDGNSTQANIPKLAGQLAIYIVTETLEFQQGTRSNPMMDAVAASLVRHPDDLEAIANYFASQPAMKGTRSGRSNDRGKTLFHSERCDFCHGEGGRRQAPFVGGAPIIGGQHREYLVKAMHDIRQGKRPGDIYGLMKKTLATLSASDLEAIADYLSQL